MNNSFGLTKSRFDFVEYSPFECEYEKDKYSQKYVVNIKNIPKNLIFVECCDYFQQPGYS